MDLYEIQIEEKRQEYKKTETTLAQIQNQKNQITSEIDKSDNSLREMQNNALREEASIAQNLKRSREANYELERLNISLTNIKNKLEKSSYAQDEQKKLQGIANKIQLLNYKPDELQSTYEELMHLSKSEQLNQQLKLALVELPKEQDNLTQLQELNTNKLKDIEHATERLSELQTIISGKESIEQNFAETSSDLAAVESSHNDLIKRLGDIEASLKRFAELETEIENKTSQILELRSAQNIYQELAYAFGRQGIQALIIETILPNMAKEQTLHCNELTAKEHSTKPPARFTEASLVKELETEGIGRPSTFANIIDTIVYRTYVNRDRGKLTPTFLGIAVTQLLENHFTALVDTKFTANMEDGLDAISRGEKKATPFMKDFYFGSEKQTGLEAMLEDKVDIGKACSVQFENDGDPIEIRVGQYGPFIQQGEIRKSIPSNIYLGDINVDKALEIINQEINEDKELGIDSESGEKILLKNGPYGPYVQLGETNKRKAIPKGTNLSEVDLELGLKLIALPRTLGSHPETGDDVKADYGRFGPYVSAGKGKNGRIPPNMSPLTIELADALELINKRSNGPQELKTLGNHSETGESLILKDGRYGPYITDGKVNASLPREIDVEKLTLEEAIELINKKRAAPPRKKRRKAKKK